uniref:C3H1-type domain-containing protein n=1 Tax=Steinernema glaseri TaxID=37863 RepID=A0A1I7YS68_9BILA
MCISSKTASTEEQPSKVQCTSITPVSKGITIRKGNETVRNDLYKTVRCHRGNDCKFQALPGGCNFAHSDEELRKPPVPKDPNFVREIHELGRIPPPVEPLDIPKTELGFHRLSPEVKRRLQKEADERWMDGAIEDVRKIFSLQ